METRHVCRSKSPTHTCAAMIYLRNERRCPSCVCVYKLTESSTICPPKARAPEGYPHIHAQLCLHQPITARDTIPTGANQGGCTNQAQWPLTDLPSATLEVRATDERYARGPCNRLVSDRLCVLLFRHHMVTSRRSVNRIIKRLGIRTRQNQHPIVIIHRAIQHLHACVYSDVGYRMIWRI